MARDDAHDTAGTAAGPAGSGRDVRLILRLVLWGLFGLVLLMLVLQNGDQTEVDFLGWTVAMPLFALILGSALIGAVIAVGWMLLRGRTRGS